MRMASCRSDYASQIKEALTMQEVAERYGFHPDRSGFIKCPFHSGDNHGSLKIYPDHRGWHCFGCGAGGSVIDFTMRLFDINFRQAVVRMDADFGLGLIGQDPRQYREQRSKIIEARRLEEEQKSKLDAKYKKVAAEHCYWWQVKKEFAPAPGVTVLHPLFVEALQRLPALEYWLDENIGR